MQTLFGNFVFLWRHLALFRLVPGLVCIRKVYFHSQFNTVFINCFASYKVKELHWFLLCSSNLSYDFFLSSHSLDPRLFSSLIIKLSSDTGNSVIFWCHCLPKDMHLKNRKWNIYETKFSSIKCNCNTYCSQEP